MKHIYEEVVKYVRWIVAAIGALVVALPVLLASVD